MPWEIIALPAIISVIWGFMKGLQTKKKKYVRKS
jgi:hypothetical protein